MSEVIRFAIVGHPNEGKSSVVSTLSEDDSVPVSAIPGETVVCKSYPVKIDGVKIVDFVDTPGFQNPVYMLDWLMEHGGDGDPLMRAFIDVHEGQEQYRHDVELLRPIAEGAGIIYIVDGSRPVRQADRAEMDILRKTGRTRMAIINCKEQEIDYRQDWQLAFSQNFNAYRVFNAHHATYRERIDLLEALEGVNPDWQPTMSRVIGAFKNDWKVRTENAADIIIELLEKNTTYEKEMPLNDGVSFDAQQAKMLESYREHLSKNERRAHGELRKVFKHNLYKAELGAHSIVRDDLFSERTWHLLGLERNQLVVASAIAGAGAGVGIDALLAGSSLGLFAAGGAVVGAASAWFGGEGLAGTMNKRGGLLGRWLGGKQIQVGPVKNPQFYFILLDRALLYYDNIIHWAHGRRSNGMEVEPGQNDKVGYVSGFNDEQRKACSNHLKALAKGNRTDLQDARKQVIHLLVGVMRDCSEK